MALRFGGAPIAQVQVSFHDGCELQDVVLWPGAPCRVKQIKCVRAQVDADAFWSHDWCEGARRGGRPAA